MGCNQSSTTNEINMYETLITYLILHLAVGIPFTLWMLWRIRESYWPIVAREEAIALAFGAVAMVCLWPVLAIAWAYDVANERGGSDK